jgi:hypothetical protein
MQMSSLILFVKSKYYPSFCTANASSLILETENSYQPLKTSINLQFLWMPYLLKICSSVQ